MRAFIFILCVLLLSACIDNNSNKNQAMDNYVNKEISDRIEKINAIAKQKDTVIVNPNEVDKKVNDIILLSKDVENLQASVNKGNQYFKELSTRFMINAADFNEINTGMHVNDIGSTLKQNEMVFFNHILLKSDKNALELHAAQ